MVNRRDFVKKMALLSAAPLISFNEQAMSTSLLSAEMVCNFRMADKPSRPSKLEQIQ